MRERIIIYFGSFINDLPEVVFKGLVLLFVIGTIIILIIHLRRAWRYIIRLLLTEYILLVYCSTLIYRNVNDTLKYDYTPFWSYDNPELAAVNILNIFVFIPIGLLLGFAFESMRWHKVLLIGFYISLSIELIQLLSKRGFSEFDDILHNTLGCAIGFGVYSLIRYGYKKFSKMCMAAN